MLERLVAANPPAREVVGHSGPRSPLVYEALFRTRRSPRSTRSTRSTECSSGCGARTCARDLVLLVIHLSTFWNVPMSISCSRPHPPRPGSTVAMHMLVLSSPLLEGTPTPEWGVDAGVNVNEEHPASVHRERTRPRR